MKNLKRVLSLIVVLAMAMSMSAFAAVTQIDINENSAEGNWSFTEALDYADANAGSGDYVTFALDSAEAISDITVDPDYNLTVTTDGVTTDSGFEPKFEGDSLLETSGSVTLGSNVTLDANGEARGVEVKDGTLTIDGATIREGSADNGGGVLVDSGAKAEMTSGSIESNTASSGGGVYVEKDGTFEMSGGSMYYNTATGTDKTPVGFGGGGITAYGDVTLSGSAGVYLNNATYGGGVFLNGGGSLTTEGNSAIFSNTATRRAVTDEEGRLADASGGAGGGVYVNAGASFTMDGGSIFSNTATYDETITWANKKNGILGQYGAKGGGVYTQGRFTMNDGLIYYNGAYYQGGGVQVDALRDSKDTSKARIGSATINGGYIYGNESQYGGGLFVGGLNYDNYTDNKLAILTISGGSVYGNTASLTEEDGQVHMNNYVTAQINGGSIEGGFRRTTSTNTGTKDNPVNTDFGSLKIYGGTFTSTTGNKFDVSALKPYNTSYTQDESGRITSGTVVYALDTYALSLTANGEDGTAAIKVVNEEYLSEAAMVHNEETRAGQQWSSSDESVVTVDSNGVITPVGAGAATVTVKVGSCEFTVKVTVSAAPVAEEPAPAPSYVDDVVIIEEEETEIEEEAAPLAALPEGFEITEEEAVEAAVELGIVESIEEIEADSTETAALLVAAVSAVSGEDVSYDEVVELVSEIVSDAEADTVTYEELATVLYNLAAASGYDVSVDEDAAADFAAEALAWAFSVGLLDELTATIDAKAVLTQAQLLVIIARYAALTR